MPGIVNNTLSSINITDITNLASHTDYPGFMVAVNNTIFNGYLYFIMLWLLWVILFLITMRFSDQLLNNAMYSGGIVSIISLFLRVIEIVQNGFLLGLINDKQMWVFPITTILLAGLVWATKE